MQRRYFDNAATSFPKPAVVHDAMQRYALEIGASPGRGAYAESIEADRLLRACRASINDLIGGAGPERIAFTLNTSDALNLAIKGVALHHARRGRDVHVVTTAMDHNSVLRPLRAMEADGVRATRVAVDPVTGRADPDDVARAIEPDTRLVAINHASNVTGTIQPVAEVAARAHDAGVPVLVDAAQTVGHMPVDVASLGVDLLAFPGHKGLLGPLGTGGLYLAPGLESIVEPLREGGTGSRSEDDVQPRDLPDRYEPGSHNTPGLVGLGAAVDWILERGVERLWAHERSLVHLFLGGLREVDGVRLVGPPTSEHRCGVFSILVDGVSPAVVAERLESEHGVLTRPGLHCAPGAHATFGTDRTGGTTRLSLGPFLEADDVRAAVDGLAAIAACPELVTT